MDRKVFRLRQIPLHMKERDVSNMLEGAFGLDHSAVRIFSLARNVDVWMPSQTATLMFHGPSASLDRLLSTGQDEWKFSAVNIRPDPILDTHFRGLTALNEPANHAADCIAIPGLAGHPFGSWQRKGVEKTFMWIRDDLPQALPQVRFILYGYDSTLPSDSFQRIPDISQALLQQLHATGWTLSTCKPLLFLAHSLGGIVLKQALVTLANHPGTLEPLRGVIRGAILFGVPNFGMEQTALLSMVEKRPNEELVADLAPGSKYLSTIHDQMSGLSFLQSVTLFWAYETQESPTVCINEGGVWSRSGPKTVLVTPESATGGLYHTQTAPDLIFPINEDHSNMVKFAANDIHFNIVASKLQLLLGQIGNDIAPEGPLSTVVKSVPASSPPLDAEKKEERNMSLAGKIITSLDAEGLGDRAEIIEDKFKDTFDWIYETEEPGFIKWLRTGSGIFWISGKPGSGKSTLMKLIANDDRTKHHLIQNWRSETRHLLVSFFFNHRGTPIQKSFEGLLRSLLVQILSEERRLWAGLHAKFPSDFPSDAPIASISQSWTLDRLRQWLRYVLEQPDIPLRLTLFLDALDEFDGPKEFICQFLKDITVPENVKVCFSSRPWDIFVTNFGSCPGFRLQDFTQDDIRSYCLGSLQSVVKLAPMVEEVVLKMTERARGVFLWIKLVIKDLEAAERNGDLDDVMKLLDAIPIELDEYYFEITRRIPASHRSKTYMTLEMVARLRKPLSPERLAMYAEALPDPRKWTSSKTLEKQLKKDQRTTQRLLSTYCGGLLEIVQASNETRVQLIHQTVMDFVMDPRFKQRVLGDQAIVTTDNGHSFLAKAGILCLGGWAWSMTTGYHAHMAERTTGQSLKTFIDTEAVQKRMAAGDALFSSPIELAAKGPLELYITELLDQDRDLFRNCEEPVLSWMVHPGFDRVIASETRSRLAELALKHGYNIANDPGCLKNAIYHYNSDDRPRLLNLARLLVESGAEVNPPHRTALDSLILEFHNFELDDWYDMAMKVAQRGGKLHHTQYRRAKFDLGLSRFEGRSTTFLRQACSPTSFLGHCTGFNSVEALSNAVLRKAQLAELTPQWLENIIDDLRLRLWGADDSL